MTQHLYRMYDANENLLYIGVSVNALARFGSTSSTSPGSMTSRRSRSSRKVFALGDRGDGARGHRVGAAAAQRGAQHQCARPPRAAIRGESQLARRTDGHGHVTFDHFAPFALDEYRGLRESIDRFIDAAHHVDDPALRRPGALPHDQRDGPTTCEIVAARQYPDMHHRCEVEDLPPVQFPIARDADGRCWYMCPACDERWRCWYR